VTQAARRYLTAENRTVGTLVPAGAGPSGPAGGLAAAR
jgi:hypothetical protein